MTHDSEFFDLTPEQMRFQILGIELTPSQAAYLIAYVETLDYDVASRKTRVFVERHLEWLDSDEQYKLGFEHAQTLIAMRAESAYLRGAIVGLKGKNGTRKFNTRALDRIVDATSKRYSLKEEKQPGINISGSIVVLPAPDAMPQLKYVPPEEPAKIIDVDQPVGYHLTEYPEPGQPIEVKNHGSGV